MFRRKCDFRSRHTGISIQKRRVPAQGAHFRRFWKKPAHPYRNNGTLQNHLNPMCRQNKIRAVAPMVPDAFILPSSFFPFPALIFRIPSPRTPFNLPSNPPTFCRDNAPRRDASRRRRLRRRCFSSVLLIAFSDPLRRPMDGLRRSRAALARSLK